VWWPSSQSMSIPAPVVTLTLTDLGLGGIELSIGQDKESARIARLPKIAEIGKATPWDHHVNQKDIPEVWHGYKQKNIQDRPIDQRSRSLGLAENARKGPAEFGSASGWRTVSVEQTPENLTAKDAQDAEELQSG